MQKLFDTLSRKIRLLHALDQYDSKFNKLYNATLVCLKTQLLLTGSSKKHAKRANVSIKTDFISTTHDKKTRLNVLQLSVKKW